MLSAIVLLKRSCVFSKEEWRSRTRPRTLAPIEIGEFIANAWKMVPPEATGQALILISLRPDGIVAENYSVRPIGGKRRELAGVFEISFQSPRTASVTLSSDECARQLGTPKRNSRRIAILRPWEPVRVQINGRYSSYSGQFYGLNEYHLTLGTGSVLERLRPIRQIDLQANLV